MPTEAGDDASPTPSNPRAGTSPVSEYSAFRRKLRHPHMRFPDCLATSVSQNPWDSRQLPASWDRLMHTSVEDLLRGAFSGGEQRERDNRHAILSTIGVGARVDDDEVDDLVGERLLQPEQVANVVVGDRGF